MFEDLKEIFKKPQPYENSNPLDLWNNPHISEQMLSAHLNPELDAASRNEKFMGKSLDWLKSRFEIDGKTSILDLGCGPGLYSREFARTGAGVTAIDISDNSIRYAKREANRLGLSIEYINKDYIEYDLGEDRYDLITLIYCDYCVLSKDKRIKLLQKVARALKAGGSFVFDVHGKEHFASVEESHSSYFCESTGFWLPESHFVFEQVFKYDEERIILQKNDIIGRNRRFTIYNYLQCFDLETITGEINESGLDIIETYSDVSGTPYSSNGKDMALVVGKK